MVGITAMGDLDKTDGKKKGRLLKDSRKAVKDWGLRRIGKRR